MKTIALIFALAGIILLYIDYKLAPIIKYKYIPKQLSDENIPKDAYKPMFDSENIWLENYMSKKQ